MIGFCPSCQKETVLTRVRRVEEFDIKGEHIAIDVDYFQCLECGEGFDNTDPAYEPLAAAHREYRQRKGMLQPEEIRAFRKTYDLSQRELSEVIGFGGATLSRYENGSLQDESHDKLLRLIMLPANLLKIVEEDSQALDTEKRQQLVNRLRDEIARTEFIRLINRNGQYGEPNLFNGMQQIDFHRLANTVKTLCYQSNVYKTRLGKLLFYADFRHFKEFGSGITGLCYLNLPQGPVPDQIELILTRLLEIDPTLDQGEDPSLDTGGEYLHSTVEPDRGGLSFSELHTLIQVDAFFKPYTSSRIKYFSLEEDGCRQTKNGGLISYEFAHRLRI